MEHEQYLLEMRVEREQKHKLSIEQVRFKYILFPMGNVFSE